MIFNLLTPQGFLSLSDYGGSSESSEKTDTGVEVYDTPARTAAAVSDIRIPLGRMVVTANASSILTGSDINAAISRHRSGDWGEVSTSDWKANDGAVKHGERILSAYTSGGNDKFWIITEADRSSTTVLMPDDY